MQTENAIGVFDSGLGGLSVLAHMRRRLPKEHFIYVADSAFIPYGCKRVEEVERRSLLVSRFLMGMGVKAVVVACNTATSAAIDSLRTELEVPLIGMEPAVKPAVQSSRSKVVGVLATSGTLGSNKFNKLARRFANQARLIIQPCPGLVEQIEKGDLNAGKTRVMLELFLQPLIEQGMDRLVLGCTHYPLIRPLIRRVIGDEIIIVDSGEAVARELARQLWHRHLLSEHQSAMIEFWSSGDTQLAGQLISLFLGEHVGVRALHL